MVKKYEAVIKEMVKEFTETIPNPEEENELIDSFEKYLEELTEKFEKNEKIDVEQGLRFTTKQTAKLPLHQKKQKLIQDESMDKIQKTSRKAYMLTQDVIMRKELKLEENELENMQKELETELANVRDFNKIQAQMLVSEGILDIKFVENPKTNILSLRLGRHVVRKKEEK